MDYDSIQESWKNNREERDMELSKYTHESAEDILAKAGALFQAYLNGTGVCTTKQLAEYYGVSENLVNKTHKNNKDEFDSDGVQTLSRKELTTYSKAKENFSLASLGVSKYTSTALIWNPRGALRLGMILTKSAVAKEVRTLMLDAWPEAKRVMSEAQQQLKEKDARIAELEAELAKTKRRTIEGIVQEEAREWDIHFNAEWQAHAVRLVGVAWNCPAMGTFINQAVYDWIPAKVMERIRQVNPVNPKTKRRDRTHHQHFTAEADPALKKKIDDALVVMVMSSSRKDFLQKIRDYHQNQVQLVLDLG
ncbi:P63C domain-containing protein [Moorena sp. SIO3A2]|uniref:P63C domain-containing protein n=1 Tax=Moorena sp. SIO3A2 TaxID=2607841 RepID=UPI0013BE0C14|nr:P63C domain-containing protein [Moorena sp. SIO3A2]NER92222.1 hypothetical protein [Moorena sp. SIO3A2]